MFKRNLTGRDFLRLRTCEDLNATRILTPGERWEQAQFAQTCRNFWFCNREQPFTLPNLDVAPALLLGPSLPTPRFSEPIILTDLLFLYDYLRIDGGTDPAGQYPHFLVRLTELGGEGKSEGEDFFGIYSSQRVGTLLVMKQERSFQGVPPVIPQHQMYCGPTRTLGFVPRLLRPYQSIVPEWTVNPIRNADLDNIDWIVQLGLRAVRVLAPDNPYREIDTLARQQTQAYISLNEPETYFMEVRCDLDDIPAAPLKLRLKTPQQGRPLLILGATSNLMGCQGGLSSETDHYSFTYAEQSASVTLPVNVPLQNPPLGLWAPAAQNHQVNMYNMFPVPHFLAPGAQLNIDLASGLMVSTTGTFQLTKSTGTGNLATQQDARITFICRTV